MSSTYMEPALVNGMTNSSLPATLVTGRNSTIGTDTSFVPEMARTSRSWAPP